MSGWIWTLPALVVSWAIVVILVKLFRPRMDERSRQTDRDVLFRSIVEQADSAHAVRQAMRLHMGFDDAWQRADEMDRAQAIADALDYYRELRLRGDR